MANGVHTHATYANVSHLHIREIYRKLLNVTNEDTTFMEQMQLLGREVVTGNSIYHNFVNSELYATEVISGTVTDNSGGSGQGLITFDVASANGTSFPRKGELVIFPSGYMGRVESNTADAGGDILQVRAVNPAVTTALLAAADTQVLVFPALSAGEQAAGPDTKRYTPTKYYNHTMIHQEAFAITDVEMASRIEFEVGGRPYYVAQAEIDNMTKFMLAEGFLCWYSQRSDSNFSASSSTLDDAAGNPVQTTRGIREYITTDGINTSSVTVNSAAFATLVRSLARARTPKSFDVYYGVNGAIAMDNFLNAIGGSPDLEAARFSVDGRELDFGVRKAHLYGYDWYFNKLGLFDHQYVTNVTGGAGYEKDVFFIPRDKVKNTDGSMADRLRIRYMQLPSNANGPRNLRYQILNTGGLAPGHNTNDTNNWKQTLRSNFGPELFAPQHCALWELS